MLKDGNFSLKKHFLVKILKGSIKYIIEIINLKIIFFISFFYLKEVINKIITLNNKITKKNTNSNLEL